MIAFAIPTEWRTAQPYSRGEPRHSARNAGPVSYTHLDVYKRQHNFSLDNCFRGDFTQLVLLIYIRHNTKFIPECYILRPKEIK